MAIFGIGTDIVEIDRIRKAISSSQGFLKKVFSADEIAYCSEKNSSYQSYAVRFAAKEAFLKALGTGWSEGIEWTDVSISNKESGAPYLIIKNKALELCQAKNIKTFHVSLSHVKDLAIAYVILEQ